MPSPHKPRREPTSLTIAKMKDTETKFTAIGVRLDAMEKQIDDVVDIVEDYGEKMHEFNKQHEQTLDSLEKNVIQKLVEKMSRVWDEMFGNEVADRKGLLRNLNIAFLQIKELKEDSKRLGELIKGYVTKVRIAWVITGFFFGVIAFLYSKGLLTIGEAAVTK